ncbi:hypothetical protein V866_003272 [Kwoniella sp. B9012]|uniref:Uncharacterized protein n=1 Tax=Kwoniella europaea PYCC6329 TaxID=1423913 RepID=A0AAX4KGN9_9TREE
MSAGLHHQITSGAMHIQDPLFKLSEVPDVVEYLANLSPKDLTAILRDERIMNDFKCSLYSDPTQNAHQPSSTVGSHCGRMVFDEIMKQVREKRMMKRLAELEKFEGGSEKERCYLMFGMTI